MALEDTAPLVLDLVEWVAREPRRYADVMDVWRTSCPRLTVWEDANDAGFLVRTVEQGGLIAVTSAGHALLVASGRRASIAQGSGFSDGA